MPSHIHPDATAPAAGYPEEPIATGPRRFHLGLIAHLEADQAAGELIDTLLDKP